MECCAQWGISNRWWESISGLAACPRVQQNTPSIFAPEGDRPTMKFLTYERRKGSMRAGLLLRGNRVLDLGKAYAKLNDLAEPAKDDTIGILDSLRVISASLQDIIDGGASGVDRCRRLEKDAEDARLEGDIYPLGDTPLVAPLPAPPLVLMAQSDAAYHAWLAETVLRRAIAGDDAALPICQSLSSALIASPAHEVTYSVAELEPDVEAHLAVVVGRDLHRASLDEAREGILGYTGAVCWVGRIAQGTADRAGLGAGAAYDAGISLGPWIVTADELEEPAAMKVKYSVNREERGGGTTAGGRFVAAELLSVASQARRIPAGTVLLMGGIRGLGSMAGGRFLESGDKVEVNFSGIGTVRGLIA